MNCTIKYTLVNYYYYFFSSFIYLYITKVIYFTFKLYFKKIMKIHFLIWNLKMFSNEVLLRV